jgi:selenocysteine lyase/cysteine desulfurase
MLPSQRDAFDIPRDVCYLNAASWSPLPRAVQAAGHEGVDRKARPWAVDPGLARAQHERTRAAAAALIGAAPEDVALIPSVSYGVAVAGKIFAPEAGTRVLLIEDDHSSPVLEWMTRAGAQGFEVEVVRRPGNGDWTSAVLEAIARPGAAPVSLASISSVHWADGGVIDIAAIAPALRSRGAALLVDATHGAGVTPLNMAELDPDFLIFPTYKWVLGPYGRAFMYIAKRWQEGVPLEQTGFGRRAIASEVAPYMKDTAFAPTARRFDMGERDHFISLEMAAVGMEMMAEWGPGAISERLGALTDRLAEGLVAQGAVLTEKRFRVPHILSIAFPGGMPEGLVEKLAAAGAHVAPRLGRVRISPHVYNDEADVDRFLEIWGKVTQ